MRRSEECRIFIFPPQVFLLKKLDLEWQHDLSGKEQNSHPSQTNHDGKHHGKKETLRGRRPGHPIKTGSSPARPDRLGRFSLEWFIVCESCLVA
jgi:hypothetical protein